MAATDRGTFRNTIMRRLVRLSGWVAALALGVGGLVWYQRSSEKLLDARGTRVASYYSRGSAGEVVRVDWLSASTLLEIPSPLKSARTLAWSYDPVTGATRRLDGFNSSWRATAPDYPVIPMLSPDRRWAMCWCVSLRGAQRKEWMAAVSVDGSRRVTWPTVSGGIRDYLGHGWLCDNRTYFILFREKVLFYSVDLPGIVNRQPVPRLSDTQQVVGAIRAGIVVRDRESPLGASLLTGIRGSAPATLRRLNLDLPADCKVHRVAANAEGTRLVWEVVRNPRPPESGPSALFAWLLDTAGIPRHLQIGLWVSDGDGGRIRELGHEHDHLYLQAGWVPHTNRISYVRMRMVRIGGIPRPSASLGSLYTIDGGE